ncbi:MAG: CRISPR-associated protein Cas5 [Candidatus Nitrosocaldus sp.]
MSSSSSPESLYIFCFDISSDLAHFRDIFSHSFFRTLLAPPRTTVLGMIGAMLGYNEEDTITKLTKLYIGIKICSLKGYAKDIMTAINQKTDGGRTPVMRTLLVNPLYRIFIGSEDKKWIEDIREGALAPKYPLYLGISDCLAYINDISTIKNVNAISTNNFNCVIPIASDIEYKYYIKDNNKMIFAPEIVKTVYSFVLTSNGKKPERYIDLLMFHNCEVKLEKDIRAYDVGEPICLI